MNKSARLQHFFKGSKPLNRKFMLRDNIVGDASQRAFAKYVRAVMMEHA
jgi:hypothetical protein